MVAPEGLNFLFGKHETGDVEGGALIAFWWRTVCVQFSPHDVGSFLFVHGDGSSCRFRWHIKSYTLWAVDGGRALDPPVYLPCPVALSNTDYTAVAGFCHGDEGGGDGDGDGSSSESGTDDGGSASCDHVTLGAVDGEWAHDPPGHLPRPVSLSNTDYAAVAGFWHGDGGGGNSDGSSSDSGSHHYGNAHGDHSTIGAVDGG